MGGLTLKHAAPHFTSTAVKDWPRVPRNRAQRRFTVIHIHLSPVSRDETVSGDLAA